VIAEAFGLSLLAALIEAFEDYEQPLRSLAHAGAPDAMLMQLR